MNTAWAIALADRLAHHGLRHAVLCPGSRSTPLALACHHHPDIDATVAIDERGAAYFALGIARATQRPTAVVTTSGTAVANLLPACIEAHHSNVPLLLLTADRPEELQDRGANQTMRQAGLFDAYTRFAAQAPHPDGDTAAIEGVVDAAMAAMTSWPPGPAHIDQPLREPLEPDASDQGALLRLEAQATRPPTPPQDPGPDGAAAPIEAGMLGPRGLIVCGPATGDIGGPLASAAEALGAVVLTDATSGVRFGMARGLDAYDAYIDHRAVLDLRPDWILHLGRSPTSKALRRYLAHHADVPRYRLDSSGRHWDDIDGDVRFIDADPARLLEAWRRPEGDTPGSDPAWRAAWEALEHLAHSTQSAMLEEAPDMEAAWVAPVVEHSERLFVGNSMPVRDLDCFARRSTPLTVYANRGVSGIDGTIATAAGIAHAAGPTVAVIGDVAFQHDVGSLALLPDDLRLVVIDNGGGRIFHHLPVNQATPHFERLFVTPPSVDPATACQAFGRTCVEATPSRLAEALASPAKVIVVRTEGEASALWRQQMTRRIHRGVPDALAQASSPTRRSPPRA